MKKTLALLLALLMLMTMVACGAKEDPKDSEDTKKTDTDKKDEEGKGAPDVEMALLDLAYDESAWNLIEDDVYDEEDYCYLNLQIPDPEDPEYYLIDAEISVSIEDPYDFRSDLKYYGFDQYDYKENAAYDLTEIGGAELLKYEGESWGESVLKYFNRIEGASATVDVTISAEDLSDSRIAELIDGITFKLEDIGNVDGPWEWEGEKFSGEDHSVAAGSFTLDTKWIPFDEYISTDETFDHSVAVVGNSVYLLTDGALKEYSFDGEKLSFVADIELEEDDYQYIVATDDGTLWLSGSLNVVSCVKDGKVSATFEELSDFAVHPSGTWGISYFTGSECQKATFSGDTYTASPMSFAEVDSVSYVNIDEDGTIYVGGYAADESGYKMFVYDSEGNLKATLCDSEGDSLGSLTYITRTANGYIGFDGNMRTVILWDNAGAFIGEASDGDLFGTGYPWFCASDMLSDGSILSVMTDERADRSATELIAFIVKGF